MSTRNQCSEFGVLRLIAAICFFISITAGTARAQRLIVNLPDSGLFSLWVSSDQGTLSVAPFTTHGHSSIAFPIPPEQGQKLYVLDGKTGRLAATPVNISPSGNAAPLTLLVGDFNPLDPSGEPSAAAPRPAIVALGHSGSPEEDRAAEASAVSRGEEEWETPLAAFLVGMVLAGFGAWVLHKLVRRSQPAYEYSAPSTPAWEPRGPVPNRAPESDRKKRPRYRVAKSSDRGSRRRSRAHMPRLVGTEGLAAGARFVLSSPTMSIGRDGDNEIVLAETKVSRRHARIESGASGYITLIDEASANGVYVNGMRVEKAVLHQGDEIKIGDSFFRFEE